MPDTLTLEEQSLWYHYKAAVWNSRTPAANTVHNIMRTIRAIKFGRGLAYVSVPITSGSYLYSLQLNDPELTDSQRTAAAIHYNYGAGLDFADKLSASLDCPVLYPADLIPVHETWEQPDFQALWLSIIAESCTQLHMSSGWQFSNGGCEEFTHVMQLRLGLPFHSKLLFFNTKENESEARARMRSIKVFDHHGAPLDIDQAMQMMSAALAWMSLYGFKAPKIEHCLEFLYTTRAQFAAGFYQ